MPQEVDVAEFDEAAKELDTSSIAVIVDLTMSAPPPPIPTSRHTKC